MLHPDSNLRFFLRPETLWKTDLKGDRPINLEKEISSLSFSLQNNCCSLLSAIFTVRIR